MSELTLLHFLILAAVLFALGIFGLLTRRNAIGILMSIELMFNGAATVSYTHLTLPTN
mgnify:CR=1 FL=1